MNEWIDVKERLPETDGEYLVLSRYPSIGYERVVAEWTDGEWWAETILDFVTHRMPLPDPPKLGGK